MTKIAKVFCITWASIVSFYGIVKAYFVEDKAILLTLFFLSLYFLIKSFED